MSTNTSEAVQGEATGATLDGVRPLLRRDVLYADTGQGVFIRHADDAFVMRGSSIYRWLSVLAPHLDGTLRVADLRSSLPEAQQQMLTSLVAVLLERGFARDSTPEELGEAVLDHPFARQIEFIRHYVDAPVRRFEQFRNATVLLVGTGLVTDATARTLNSNGLSTCSILEREPATPAGLAGADLVVAIGDSIGLAGVRQVARDAAEAGVPLLPAVTVGARSFVGPLLETDAGIGVDTMLARLGAGLDSDESADFFRRLAGVEGAARARPVPQHAAMLGSLLGFDVFRLLTGCLEPETRGATIVQNLETLDTVKEPVLGHPSDPRTVALEEVPEAELLAGLDVVPDQELEVESTVLHEQADGYLDLLRHHTGVFRQFVDLEIDQSPLKVGRVEVGGLAGRDGSAPARRVITACHTRTPLQARFRALGQAALQYVDTWGPELSRSVTTDSDVLPQALDLWSGTGAVAGRPSEAADSGGLPGVRATSLVSGRPTRVPLAAAYPFSAANEAGPVLRSTVGAGAGATPVEAATEAFFSAVTYRAVLSAVRGAVPVDSIELRGGEPGTLLRFLGDTCRTLGLEPVLLDVSLPGCGGTVLAYAEHAGDTMVAMETGASTEQAAVAALVCLVGRVQTDGPTTTHVGPLADLDPRGLPVSGTSHPPAGDPQSVASMIAALGAGTDVLLVDTTLPDLAQGGLRTARVLLTAASGLPGEDAPQASDDGPTHTERG